LQNLPEGFNYSREIQNALAISNTRMISLFLALPMLGPVCGIAGYYWLASYPDSVSAVMLFASGGMLYITFTDIAPGETGKSLVAGYRGLTGIPAGCDRASNDPSLNPVNLHAKEKAGINLPFFYPDGSEISYRPVAAQSSSLVCGSALEWTLM
jgi:hypothetical protein